jgi:hypothetical protein
MSICTEEIWKEFNQSLKKFIRSLEFDYQGKIIDYEQNRKTKYC